MIDVDKLTPAERALYVHMFPNGIAPGLEADPHSARVSSLDALWVFAAICYRTVGTLPKVAVEMLVSSAYRPRLEFELWARAVARMRAERQRRVRLLFIAVHEARLTKLANERRR